MANSLPSYGILSVNEFQPLRLAAARLSSYSRDFSPEISSGGTSIAVAFEGATSASLWTAASGYTTSDTTDSTTTVTLKEPYHVEKYLSPNELGAYGETKLKNKMANTAAGVFDEIRKQGLAILQGASVPTVAVVLNAAHNFNTVLSASTVLCNSGSQGAQTFMCPRVAYNALLVDSKNANYKITSTNVDGKASFSYDMLPNVTVTAEDTLTVPVITTSDALALAIRLPEQMFGTERTIFVDAGQTEAAVAVDLVNDAVGGKIKMRAQACVGVALGRTGAAAKFSLS